MYVKTGLLLTYEYKVEFRSNSKIMQNLNKVTTFKCTFIDILGCIERYGESSIFVLICCEVILIPIWHRPMSGSQEKTPDSVKTTR